MRSGVQFSDAARGSNLRCRFHAAILATYDYGDVTQEKRLGKVRIEGKHALDLEATGRRSSIHYGISVKNEREWLHPGSRSIKDVFNKAKEHRVSPWLVVAFATEAAAERCARDGIRLTVLGHRVAPRTTAEGKRLRPLFERIRPVLGPEPFEFLAERPESLGPVWLEERWQKFLDNEPTHAVRGAS